MLRRSRLRRLRIDAAQAADRAKGDTKLFAPVPAPGAPEPVVIAPDGTVYTATLNAESGDTAAPSQGLRVHARRQAQARPTTSAARTCSSEHGLTGMAMDADGYLYVGSLAPPVVCRLDPKTGEQTTYATLRDVPPCSATVTTRLQKSTTGHEAVARLHRARAGRLAVRDRLAAGADLEGPAGRRQGPDLDHRRPRCRA